MPVEVDTPVLGRKSFVAHLSSQVKSNQTKSQGKEQRAESATSNPTAATKQPRDGHPTPEYRAPTAGGAPHTHKHPNSLARTTNKKIYIHPPTTHNARTLHGGSGGSSAGEQPTWKLPRAPSLNTASVIGSMQPAQIRTGGTEGWRTGACVIAPSGHCPEREMARRGNGGSTTG